MRELFADLHVHLGRAAGRWVKVSAAAALTLEGIAATARRDKGVELVGVVDLWTAPAREELARLLGAGRWREVAGGGFTDGGGVTVLGGAELALAGPRGPYHVVALLPDRAALERFARDLAAAGTRDERSTASFPGRLGELARLATAAGGIWFPAHVFTPHRGLYAAADGMAQVLEEGPAPAAVELGLSADTAMAAGVAELAPFPFLSNSDAHSLGKLGREANRLRGERPCFAELAAALAGRGGRGIVANYGLDPRLGKYHRSFCPACRRTASEPPPVLACPLCGGKVVVGVADRVAGLTGPGAAAARPPYRHQLPLEFIPGIGPRTAARLVAALGGELAVLHLADEAALAAAAGPQAAGAVLRARRGELTVAAGGGGVYGRVRGMAGGQGA